MNGLAGCSVSAIGKPHEYLDPTSFEWLEKACDERSGTLLFTPTNPIARDLEHDPRFPT